MPHFITDKFEVIGSRQPFVKKGFSRLIASESAEWWHSTLEGCIDSAVAQLKRSVILDRTAIAQAVAADYSTRKDAIVDVDAASDVIRFAVATFRICLIPVVLTSGFPSDAVVLPTDVNTLRLLRLEIADRLESNGWLQAKQLANASVGDWNARGNKWAELALAHASACGNGEYHSNGLFYRRPFVREAS